MAKRKKPKPQSRSQKSGSGAGGDDYKVGRGRPPSEHQWQPGQSGNKKGRKKGSKNRKTLVRAAQRRLHTMMRRAGRPRKMLIDEIGIHNIEQDIKRGDRKAWLEWLEISDRYGDRNEAVASMLELQAEDRAILANLLARKGKKSPPSQDDL